MVKRIIRRIFRLFIKDKAYKKRKAWEKQCPEIKKSLGKENSNHRFYVIRRPMCINEGVFSQVVYYFGHIVEAYERNLIPVIDMKSEEFYSKRWQRSELKGLENAWEYMFE